MNRSCFVVLICVIFAYFLGCAGAVTMKQFEASLNMLRSICAPKYNVKPETLDALRKGIFEEDQELKCYTKCIAQITGTLTKKGGLDHQVAMAQINTILPDSIKEMARKALDACIDVPQNVVKTHPDVTFTRRCFDSRQAQLQEGACTLYGIQLIQHFH